MAGTLNIEFPPGFDLTDPEKSAEILAAMNKRLRNIQDAVERLQGARGVIQLHNDINMNQHRITGLGHARDQEDAVNVKEGNDRYFEPIREGGGGGGGGGVAVDGDIFLIPVELTSNLTITEDFLANINSVAAGNHPIYVGLIQPADTAWIVQWDPDDFFGASTTGLNLPMGEWGVDTTPGRTTVFHFVRHPENLLWWLASWISYPNYSG